VFRELISWAPWVAFAFGMFLTFIAIYNKSGSFRKAFLGSLLVGKTFAVIYWVAGLNRTLLTIYLINRRAPWVVHEIRITACLLLILSFATAAATTAAWPLIIKHAPREARKALEELQK